MIRYCRMNLKLKFIQDSGTASFGVFTLSHNDIFTKITCANMVTHTTTTPKSEIQVNSFHILNQILLL